MRLTAFLSRLGTGSVLVVLLIAGLGLLGLAAWASSPSEALRDVVRDIGIALLVAVLVAKLIELDSHRRREEEARRGGTRATLELMFGPEVWPLIKSTMIPDDVFCERWDLDVRISKETVDLNSGGASLAAEEHLVSRGTLNYTLRNPLKSERSTTLRHELETERSGTSPRGAVPAVTAFSYEFDPPRGTAVHLDATALAPGGSLGKNGIFELSVTLPANSRLKVSMERAEVVAAQFPWFMFFVTLKPHVKVRPAEGSDLAFGIRLRHPQSRDLPANPDNEWTIPDCLPGQGFAIQ